MDKDKIVFDIETNGLKPDKIWCIAAKPLGEAVVSFGPNKIKEGIMPFPPKYYLD